MKLNEIIKKSIESEEKNMNLNPYEYDKVWDKIECEIDKRDSKISERIKKITNSFRENLKLPFNYKDVIQVCLFIAIVVGIPLSISYYNKSFQNNIDAITKQKDITSKNAIEKIKKNYKEVLSLKEFNDHYVLVEYKRQYDGTSFDLYNLKTGHKDEVSTGGFSKLIKIINENEFLFLESGQTPDSSLWSPPCYLRSTRVKQIANTEGSFKAVWEPAFFKVDKSIVFGNKDGDMISKVGSVGNLLSVTFGPAPGKESMFYADYSYVPVTNTSYIKDKNQLVLEFKDCEIDEKLINVKRDISSNDYISGYKIIKADKDSKLVIDLKSTAKAYNCSTTDVANGLVKLNIKFANKAEESNSLSQSKSLEALLKSYNYNISMNSGYSYEIKIPQNFIGSSELKGLYLQYCNELSKAVGYDMSTLGGETVEVTGCSVNKAGNEAKAFEVESIGLRGKIYGVWMREHGTGRLLSLTEENFTEITKKSWQKWIQEKGITVSNKDIIDNEFKNIAGTEIIMKGVK
jgi:hypothetical protein